MRHLLIISFLFIIGWISPAEAFIYNAPVSSLSYVTDPYADARAYGVRCDGVTDDSAALNAALVAKMNVQLPSGTCIIDAATINLRGYRTLRGMGRSNTVLKAGTNLTGYVITSNEGASGDWFPHTKIQDLTIDGNGSTNALGGIYAEFITRWEFERIEVLGFYKATAVGINLDHAYNIAFRDVYVRMGSAGAGKKGTAAFQIGASTADAIHTTHITFDNCLAQYSGTGFFLSALGNRGGPVTIRQSASGNHDYGIRIQDFYREVSIEDTLIENTSINGVRISTATAYNIANIRLNNLTLYENTTAIFATNVDGLRMDHLRLVGDDAGGHTAFNLTSIKRCDLGTYMIEDTAYNTIVTGGSVDPRIANLNLNDGTPDVFWGAKRQSFFTQSTNPTTISAFDNGVTGQEITVIFNDANTTIDFTGTTLKGNGGVDFTGGLNDIMRCIFDGTNWNCAVHNN